MELRINRVRINRSRPVNMKLNIGGFNRITFQVCKCHWSSSFLMAQLKWSWQYWHFGKGQGGCAWHGSVHGGGGGGEHVWQERRPLQRTVSILLECILVLVRNDFMNDFFYNIVEWCTTPNIVKWLLWTFCRARPVTITLKYLWTSK